MSTSIQSDSAAKKDVTKLQRAIIDGLEDVKAQDIQVFNTEHLSPLFERVIIATGSSNRQTKALAVSVRDAVKKAGFKVPRNEGEENGEWIIVDCGQCVVHIMQPMIRQYYRLEEIWGEKPVRVKLGGAKPAKIFASEDASEEAAKPAAKKPAARKTTAAAKPAAAVKKAPAKKAATKTTTAATKKPAAKKAAAVKTVVIKPTAPRGGVKKAKASTAKKA